MYNNVYKILYYDYYYYYTAWVDSNLLCLGGDENYSNNKII